MVLKSMVVVILHRRGSNRSPDASVVRLGCRPVATPAAQDVAHVVVVDGHLGVVTGDKAAPRLRL